MQIPGPSSEIPSQSEESALLHGWIPDPTLRFDVRLGNSRTERRRAAVCRGGGRGRRGESQGGWLQEPTRLDQPISNAPIRPPIDIPPSLFFSCTALISTSQCTHLTLLCFSLQE